MEFSLSKPDKEEEVIKSCILSDFKKKYMLTAFFTPFTYQLSCLFDTTMALRKPFSA